MRMKAFLAVCACACAAVVFASTETDWSQKTGTVTVPVDATWYADEADMTAVNALNSINVEGSLVFRDTTTVPKASLLAGTGTVHKTGLSVWANYANAQTSFTGDWHLDGGVVTNTAAGSFGKIDATTVGKLYVHDGAALVVNNASTEFFYRDLHIAGAGNLLVPRALSMPKIKSAGVRHLYLDADATIETGPDHYWISDQGGTARNGVLNLGEHTLTQYGENLEWHFLGITVNGTGGIVFKGKGFTLRTVTWGSPGADSDPLVFGGLPGGVQNFYLYNKPVVLRRDLRFDGPVSYLLSANENAARRGLMETNINHFAGNLLLNGAASQLNVALGSYNAAVSFSGTISGEGGVQVGNMGNWERGILNLFGHNTYGGSTVVTANGVNGIMAAWPDSVPDSSKTVVSNGSLAARLGMAADGVTPRWTANDIWNAMNSVTFAGTGHFSINAEDCENATHEIAVADIVANVPDEKSRTIGCAGGTLKLRVDAGDEQRIGLAVDRGTLELVGGGTFHLAPTNSLKGGILPGNTDALPLAELRVTDGSTVVQNDECVHVGGTFSSGSLDARGCARLVVSNATWKTEFDTGYSSGGEPELGRGAIWLGHLNAGILEIQNGGCVSNKVVVGGGGTSAGGGAHEGNGVGAVYLGEGGFLYMPRKGNAHLTSNIGATNPGYGYLEQSGGELGGNGIQVANYGPGVAHVYGGVGRFVGSINLAVCNNGMGILYITNGTWNSTSYLLQCSGNTCESHTTVDGPNAAILLNGNEANVYGGNNATYVIRINVNHGGTLQFGRVIVYDAGALDKTTKPQPYVLNVNGGILRRHNDWSESGMFGASSVKRFSRVVVYEEGMTVDVPTGKDVVQIAEMPFEGADGNGIMSIDLGGEVEGLLGAPYVKIENTDDGAGYGASAVGDWDPKTRTLKGVHITSHGWGYTQGKVKVTLSTGGAWSKALTGDAITVGPNTSGGFTKRGEGLLTLNATNTWTKWTRVEGGTLKVNADWAIPPDTDLTLSGGGILNFNGKTGEVASVTYGAGGGSIVNAENAVIPALSGFLLDIDDVMAGKSVPFAGDLDLTGKTLTLTGDLTKLDTASARRYPLILVSNGTASGAFAVSPELPANWFVVTTDDGVRLIRPHGTSFILR